MLIYFFHSPSRASLVRSYNNNTLPAPSHAHHSSKSSESDLSSAVFPLPQPEVGPTAPPGAPSTQRPPMPQTSLAVAPQPNTHPVVSTGVQPTIPTTSSGWPRVPRSPRWGRLGGGGELGTCGLGQEWGRGVWVSVWRLGGREGSWRWWREFGTDGNATPYSQGMPLLKSTALMCRVSASHR